MAGAPPVSGSVPPSPGGIVGVVSPYVELSAGQHGGLTGACPFCGSAAFHVRPDHGTFHCFRCGAGGDEHGFVREIEQR